MSEIYIPTKFKIQDLVYPEYLNAHEGESDEQLFSIFNPDLLRAADLLVDRYGPCFVNNYSTGGSLKECGLRADGTTTGAKMSAHKSGNALDMHFTKISAEEIRQEMKRLGCFDPGFKTENTDPDLESFRLLTEIEWHLNGKPISWYHISCRPVPYSDGSIKIINC